MTNSTTMAVLSLLCFAGCAGEADSGPAATGPELRAQGIYYLSATGTAEEMVLTYYDQNHAVIGGGQTSATHVELHWKEDQWEVDMAPGGDDTLLKNGQVVPTTSTPDDYAQVRQVLELAMKEAHLPNHTVQATSCKRLNGYCGAFGGACCPGFRCSSACWLWCCKPYRG